MSDAIYLSDLRKCPSAACLDEAACGYVTKGDRVSPYQGDALRFESAFHAREYIHARGWFYDTSARPGAATAYVVWAG